MLGARRGHVRNVLHERFISLVYVDIRAPVRLGSTDVLNMLINFQEARCVSGVYLIRLCVTGALNTFLTCLA